jgi:hypothetical protein
VMEGSTRMSAEASSVDEMEAARDFGASSPSPQHWPSDPDPVTRATSHPASTTAEPSREHVGESTPVTAPFVPEPTPERAIEAARDAEPRVPSPAPISRPVERAAGDGTRSARRPASTPRAPSYRNCSGRAAAVGRNAKGTALTLSG